MTGYVSIKTQKSSYSILGESYVFIEILSLNEKKKSLLELQSKNPKKQKCKWEIKSRNMKRKRKEKKFYKVFENIKISFFYYTYHCTVPNIKVTLKIFCGLV